MFHLDRKKLSGFGGNLPGLRLHVCDMWLLLKHLMSAPTKQGLTRELKDVDNTSGTIKKTQYNFPEYNNNASFFRSGQFLAVDHTATDKL